MPDSEVSVKATYKNAPVTTYSLTTQVNGGHGTISASKNRTDGRLHRNDYL